MSPGARGAASSASRSSRALESARVKEVNGRKPLYRTQVVVGGKDVILGRAKSSPDDAAPVRPARREGRAGEQVVEEINDFLSER